METSSVHLALGPPLGKHSLGNQLPTSRTAFKALALAVVAVASLIFGCVLFFSSAHMAYKIGIMKTDALLCMGVGVLLLSNVHTLFAKLQKIWQKSRFDALK
ncbi:MAG: hypothetical protein LLG04_14165 [Parachlamydia sp.]|nr:hypothetical protein [Parachlamydia sp.]